MPFMVCEIPTLNHSLVVKGILPVFKLTPASLYWIWYWLNVEWTIYTLKLLLPIKVRDWAIPHIHAKLSILATIKRLFPVLTVFNKLIEIVAIWSTPLKKKLLRTYIGLFTNVTLFFLKSRHVLELLAFKSNINRFFTNPGWV